MIGKPNGLTLKGRREDTLVQTVNLCSNPGNSVSSQGQGGLKSFPKALRSGTPGVYQEIEVRKLKESFRKIAAPCTLPSTKLVIGQKERLPLGRGWSVAGSELNHNLA